MSINGWKKCIDHYYSKAALLSVLLVISHTWHRGSLAMEMSAFTFALEANYAFTDWETCLGFLLLYTIAWIVIIVLNLQTTCNVSKFQKRVANLDHSSLVRRCGQLAWFAVEHSLMETPWKRHEPYNSGIDCQKWYWSFQTVWQKRRLFMNMM